MLTGVFKSVGASVMVWGMSNWYHMRPLIRLETSDRWQVRMHLVGSHSCPLCILTDLDNSSWTLRHPHMSRVSTERLQRASSDRYFHWPLKSPEMNINEHISDSLQLVVQKGSPPPHLPMSVMNILHDSWCDFHPGYFQTLVKRMPHRCCSTSACSCWSPTRY